MKNSFIESRHIAKETYSLVVVGNDGGLIDDAFVHEIYKMKVYLSAVSHLNTPQYGRYMYKL